MADTLRVRRESNYFPLRVGYTMIYQHTNTDFQGIETVEVRITKVTMLGDETTADMAVTRTRMGQSAFQKYRVTRTPKEVRADGGVLGLSRTEFPIPAIPGKKWDQYPDTHEVAALDASVEVPAGKFDRCLRVNAYLAGGDAGSAVRCYAPEVGYVYEEYAEEAWGARVQLMSFRMENAELRR